MPGREIELAVLEGLDGAPPDVSVPAEILLSDGREWYDFEAKYLDDVSALDIPADLPADVTARGPRFFDEGQASRPPGNGA